MNNIKSLPLKLVFAIFSLISSSCTDVEGTKKTVERFGFRPIEVGGYSFWNGSATDRCKTKFKAVALNGDTVTGAVTKGWIFKGSTIRLND
ncbi:MAG: hypothetical protein JNL70_00580 [Saprospiraceae bacterium]|nr:hypothetical protein [Saprospiraceae bacterium]